MLDPTIARHLVGDWQGFVPLAGSPSRLVLKIRISPHSEPLAFLDMPDSAALSLPFDQFAFDGRRIRGEQPSRNMLLCAELRKDGMALEGEFQSPEGGCQICLQRNRPEFLAFEFPRLSSSGRPEYHYVYKAPPKLDDGLGVASATEAGVNASHLQDLMSATLSGAFPNAHSVLVAKAGKLTVEEYFYGSDRDTRHTVQSCSKSITSILIGQAIEQGLIPSVDTPVYTFFPERKGRRWVDERYGITLKHLLTMTAALDWNEEVPYVDPRNDNTRMNNSGDLVGYVLDKTVSGDPGQHYAYTSGLSILLGAILKNVSGLSADEFAARHLFAPLGIAAHRWWCAPDGTCHTGGGLSLRPRDFAKIGLMMLNDGLWNSKRVVSSAWVRESTARHTRPDDYGYGYQWHIHPFTVNNTRVESFCGKGYGGQFLFVFRQLDLVVVLTAGDWLGGGARPYERMERYILPAVL